MTVQSQRPCFEYLYRAFDIYCEADGWWAESAGGICFGPFDDEVSVKARVDAYLDRGED